MFNGFKLNLAGVTENISRIFKQIAEQSLEIKRDNEYLNSVQSNRLNILQNKQYLGGQTYNGVVLNITSTNGTLVRGVLIPYKTMNGYWRLKANACLNYSPSTATETTITIAGITYEATTGNYQAGSALTSLSAVAGVAICNPNTSNIIIRWSGGGSASIIGISIDVELASKPTWAD